MNKKHLLLCVLSLLMPFLIKANSLKQQIKDKQSKNQNEYIIESDENFRPLHLNTLWYLRPAIDNIRQSSNPWMEYALPIGNGQLGAMIFSNVKRDIVQINEKSLWQGDSKHYGSYLNFANLYIEDISPAEKITDYVRYLDLEEARASMKYTKNNINFTRDYISSYPDQAIIIRLKSSKKGGLNHRFTVDNPNNAKIQYKDATISFRGKLQLLSFALNMRVISSTGDISTSEDAITVSNSDEILLIITAGTNYKLDAKDFTFNPKRLYSLLEKRVKNLSKKNWNELYSTHLNDYKKLYDRLTFKLQGAENDCDTYTLVNEYSFLNRDLFLNKSLNLKDKYSKQTLDYLAKEKSRALMLEQLYFNYARYLLISSSRGISLPANLQGIWNNTNTPPWKSDIHANINVQMNYWPAENLNLSDLHMPFLDYIYQMAIKSKQWKQNAKDAGQTKGWTCYTENNIFAYHGGFAHNYVIANAWYALHMWQHYLYTLDKDYLREKAFPVMKSATDFWLERLIQDRKIKDGTWVAPNEYSPEHGPGAEDATAHAQQFIYNLFSNTLKAIKILSLEKSLPKDFLEDLKNKFEHLDKGLATETIAGKEVLREWKYTSGQTGKNGVQAHHRHMSHLMVLHPLGDIDSSSIYFPAIINSLNHRGDASTGWSMGWKINLWARALDGNRAYNILRTALRHSTSYRTDASRGGIYYNLFDSHAPFQIDGNFGAAAGIGEMLLQSYNGKINILPALPDFWTAGSIDGIRAEGGIELDIKWSNNILSNLAIKNINEKDIIVEYKNIADYKCSKTDSIEVLSKNKLKIKANTGYLEFHR